MTSRKFAVTVLLILAGATWCGAFARTAVQRGSIEKVATREQLPSGSVSKSDQIDGDYGPRIVEKVRTNFTYATAADVQGNPRVTFRIEMRSSGEVTSIKEISASGYPDFDSAVLKGIVRASPLPKKSNGTVERVIELNFAMKP